MIYGRSLVVFSGCCENVPLRLAKQYTGLGQAETTLHVTMTDGDDRVFSLVCRLTEIIPYIVPLISGFRLAVLHT